MNGELYRLFDTGGELLYIGKTISGLSDRVHQHRRRHWWPEVTSITIQRIPLADLTEAERLAIKTESPRHNDQHTEDRHSSYKKRVVVQSVLKADITEWVAARRAEGNTWSDITDLLVELTGIRVTKQTAWRWGNEAPVHNKAALRAALEVAA